jgi:predicted negative regulator of RcsB-dependent stress response
MNSYIEKFQPEASLFANLIGAILCVPIKILLLSACFFLSAGKNYSFVMRAQDTTSDFFFKFWPWLDANKNRVMGIAIALIVLFGGWAFFGWQREQKESAAGEALSQLLMPTAPLADPANAFLQLADKYAGTTAANRARLQGAAALFSTGHYADAQAQFQKFLDENSNSPLSATAALGVAASLEAQNKLDLAAIAYQKITSNYADSAVSLIAKFALGRIAESQGRLTEAASDYEAVARVNNGTSLASEAGLRLMEIRSKLPATAKPISILK